MHYTNAKEHENKLQVKYELPIAKFPYCNTQSTIALNKPEKCIRPHTNTKMERIETKFIRSKYDLVKDNGNKYRAKSTPEKYIKAINEHNLNPINYNIKKVYHNPYFKDNEIRYNTIPPKELYRSTNIEIRHKKYSNKNMMTTLRMNLAMTKH